MFAIIGESIGLIVFPVPALKLTFHSHPVRIPSTHMAWLTIDRTDDWQKLRWEGSALFSALYLVLLYEIYDITKHI